MPGSSTNIKRVCGPDGAIVLDVRRGAMFRLNPLGSRIMESLERGDSASQIVQQLSREFDVPQGTVEADVREFLSALALHGLIDPQDPAL